jgi:protein-L-isoaspartate(D-aspartate) O-methyltransferase
MVERQLRRREIADERVLEAMATVPREEFVPQELRGEAYRDGALRIEAGQTISQPWIVARMAELLELQGPERVLEVGTGSGYAAAVLSLLCSHVVTVERHASLALAASDTLSRLGYGNVEVRHGDGSQGVADRAPFDAISVTATASEEPPRVLRDQAVPDAPIVLPLQRGGRELLVRVRGTAVEAVTAVRFVPLLGGTED